MKQKCIFNRDRDLFATRPNLSLDLSQAVETGVIDNSNVNASFNMIEDCNQIGQRVTDNFEVYNKQKEISQMLESSKQPAPAPEGA